MNRLERIHAINVPTYFIQADHFHPACKKTASYIKTNHVLINGKGCTDTNSDFLADITSLQGTQKLSFCYEFSHVS